MNLLNAIHDIIINNKNKYESTEGNHLLEWDYDSNSVVVLSTGEVFSRNPLNKECNSLDWVRKQEFKEVRFEVVLMNPSKQSRYNDPLKRGMFDDFMNVNSLLRMIVNSHDKDGVCVALRYGTFYLET